jgi:anti-sigma factor RsiW
MNNTKFGMQNLEQLYEKIEDYLLARLPEPEREAFEAEIQADPALAEEVALHRALIEATDEEDIKELRRLMEELLPKPAPQARLKAIRRQHWHWWAVAAAAAAVLLAWAGGW